MLNLRPNGFIRHSFHLREFIDFSYILLMFHSFSPRQANFTTWSDFRLQLFWVSESAPTSPYRHSEYRAQPQAAWLIRRGSVRLKFSGFEETFESGYWVFPRAEDGWQEFSADADILSLRFIAEWPTGEPLFDRSVSRAIPKDDLAAFTRISTRLVHTVEKEFPGLHARLVDARGSLRHHFGFQRLLNGWMLEYAAAMERLGLTPYTLDRLDERVKGALHAMHVQPINQLLSEHELALKTGLSVSQLNKLFVRDIGRTPKEYWEEKRIHTARLALLDTSRSVKTIAYDLGFSSLQHFSSWSKKRLGQTPRDFRLNRGS